MKPLATLAIVSALGSSAFAAPVTYVIDSTHTLPRFEYSHFGYSTQLSRFDKASGKIILDRAAQTGSVEVEIDAKSVDTGYPVFNGHIQGEDFFNTEKYPIITFKSESVKFKGGQPVAVQGDLTIKGITKTVTLKVTSFKCMPHPMLKKDACGANATATVKRSEFGMGKYAPHVSDEVVLTIPVEAVAE